MERRDLKIIKKKEREKRKKKKCMGDVYILGRGNEIEKNLKGLVCDMYNKKKKF